MKAIIYFTTILNINHLNKENTLYFIRSIEAHKLPSPTKIFFM